MTTRKPAADSMSGVQISLGTGLSFHMGAPISPKWADAYYCIHTLANRGYLKDLLPPGLDESTSLGMSEEASNHIIPGIIRAIDNGFDTGKYTVANDYALVAVVYVLAWYWHIRLGGPRPFITSSAHYASKVKVYQNTPELGCPFCTKRFIPNPRYKRASVIFGQWVTWLTSHAKTYHKWIKED